MPRFVGPAEGVNVARQFSSRLPRAVAVTALRLISQFTGQGRQCRPCMVWPPGGVNVARRFSSRRPKGSHCHRAQLLGLISPFTGGVAIHSPGLSSRPRGGWGRTQQGSRKAREAYFHAFLRTNRPARWPGGHRRGGFWHAQKPLVSVPTMGLLQVAARHPMPWVPPA